MDKKHLPKRACVLSHHLAAFINQRSSLALDPVLPKAIANLFAQQCEGLQKCNIPSADETLDAFVKSKVLLLQARKGYRVTIDSVILSHFVMGLSPGSKNIVDLGAGNGALTVLLGLLLPNAFFTGIEKQATLFDRSIRNTVINGLADRTKFLNIEIGSSQELLLDNNNNNIDLVVTNPPFYAEKCKHRLPPKNLEKQLAYHEAGVGTLEKFVETAAHITRGGVAVIYPAEGYDRLIAALNAQGFGRIRQRWVHHATVDEPATRIMVFAEKPLEEQNNSITDVGTPLVLHPTNVSTIYCKEIEQFFDSFPEYNKYYEEQEQQEQEQQEQQEQQQNNNKRSRI